MIFKKILPEHGGGALRRWMLFQQEIMSLMRSDPRREQLMKGPITLFDFQRRDDAADASSVSFGVTKGGWRISDDEVIGGYSRGTMKLIQSPTDYRRYMNLPPIHTSTETQTQTLDTTSSNSRSASNKEDELETKMEDEKELYDMRYYKKRENQMKQKTEPTTTFTQQQQQQQTDAMFVPFIRWSGTIDTRIGEKSRAKRSGFCAIRSPQFPFFGANLRNLYNALEFTIRSDGRIYTVNVKVSSYFPDDLYQGLITIPPTNTPTTTTTTTTTNDSQQKRETGDSDFVTIVLPFRDLLLTSSGVVRETQRVLDGNIKIEHIGLTLMDEKDGDFQFDLARIRAVNYFDGQIIQHAEETI